MNIYESVFSSTQKLEKLNFNSNGGSSHTFTSTCVDIDLFISLRGFLIIGKLFGLIPCSGLLGHSHENLRFRLWSFACFTSSLCILLLTFNASLVIANMYGAKNHNSAEIATFMTIPIFSFWGLFMYTYFLFHWEQFITIFQTWAICNQKLVYTDKDKNLKWTIILITVVIFGSLTAENVISHLENFTTFDRANDKPSLQMYYLRIHGHWNRFIGYHPILCILTFICHKLIQVGGNYADVLMIICARALYFKFNTLCKAADKVLVQPLTSEENLEGYKATEADHQAWNQLAKDHESLCQVLKAMNNFFSPIIFVSYAINVYFLCIQLLNTINPVSSNKNIVHFLYNPWSFIHTIARMLLLSLFLARVSESVHNVQDVLLHCPVQYYNGQIAKLDNRVSVGPKQGFDGLGCFTVTKSIILSILNVIFTVEIVLLQGLQGSETKAGVVNRDTELS